MKLYGWRKSRVVGERRSIIMMSAVNEYSDTSVLMYFIRLWHSHASTQSATVERCTGQRVSRQCSNPHHEYSSIARHSRVYAALRAHAIPLLLVLSGAVTRS